MNKCFFGDCRETMRQLIDDGVKVQTCVTSPPYWGLRDYGVEGQLGLEKTLDEFIETMVDVFRLVRELLRDDGTMWVNIGDTYLAQRGSGFNGNRTRLDKENKNITSKVKRPDYLKSKNLMLIPFHLVIALQRDGWIVRSDIIWAKKNCMPESVTDRPTKSHEYLFLLSKNPHYYYDADAIKEPASPESHARYARGRGEHTKTINGAPGQKPHTFHQPKPNERIAGVHPKAVEQGRGIKANESFSASVKDVVEMRNKRTVWNVPAKGYPGAHFATYPPELIEPCILAGSRVGDIVFDPFFGSGTTGEVAQNLGRQWIGCELNPEYEVLQKNRTQQQAMAL